MKITVKCPVCHNKTECESEWIGRNGECPFCQNVFVISATPEESRFKKLLAWVKRNISNASVKTRVEKLLSWAKRNIFSTSVKTRVEKPLSWLKRNISNESMKNCSEKLLPWAKRNFKWLLAIGIILFIVVDVIIVFSLFSDDAVHISGAGISEKSASSGKSSTGVAGGGISKYGARGSEPVRSNKLPHRASSVKIQERNDVAQCRAAAENGNAEA